MSGSPRPGGRHEGRLPPRIAAADATARQVDVLAAFVATGGSVSDAAAHVGIRPSTAKRHLADLRARSGFTTEQLIYSGRAAGWLVVPSLDGRTAASPEIKTRCRGSPIRTSGRLMLTPARRSSVRQRGLAYPKCTC